MATMVFDARNSCALIFDNGQVYCLVGDKEPAPLADLQSIPRFLSEGPGAHLEVSAAGERPYSAAIREFRSRCAEEMVPVLGFSALRYGGERRMESVRALERLFHRYDGLLEWARLHAVRPILDRARSARPLAQGHGTVDFSIVREPDLQHQCPRAVSFLAEVERFAGAHS